MVAVELAGEAPYEENDGIGAADIGMHKAAENIARGLFYGRERWRKPGTRAPCHLVGEKPQQCTASCTFKKPPCHRAESP